MSFTHHRPAWRTGSILLRAIGMMATTLAVAQPNPSSFGQAGAGIEAVRTRAVEGDVRAQVELGLRYVDGAGVRQDYTQAAEWFRKAAMQGDAQGQLELGVMFVNGEGMPSDLREGYAWYWLASQQGNAQARQYLDDLEGSLSSAEKNRARARADELSRTIAANKQSEPRHGRHRQTPPVGGETPGAGPGSSAAAGPAARKPAGGRASGGFAEGKDYDVWQRVRIKDQNGFAQPVEAYSILLPKGWTVDGQVKWVINTSCPADAVQNRLTAASPDGTFRLEVYPQQNWQWYDDPMLLQGAMNSAQFGGGGCPLARPFDAGQYIEQVFVPNDLRGATLTSHRPDENMSRAMLQQARENNAVYQASGVNLESRPSARIGRLKWQDGRVGIVLCAVEQTVGFMPNLLNGGTYASYQCRATVKTLLSAPAGREEEAERMLGTIVASTRINPQWQSAVQRVYNNIARVEMQETAKRAAIWRQTQSEISDLQRRTWEESQASRDRISEAWGQVLRGVETWTEPGGGRIELSSGYNEAWSKGDGTYILSNNPLFDPNVAFQEDWKRLEKGR